MERMKTFLVMTICLIILGGFVGAAVLSSCRVDKEDPEPLFHVVAVLTAPGLDVIGMAASERVDLLEDHVVLVNITMTTGGRVVVFTSVAMLFWWECVTDYYVGAQLISSAMEDPSTGKWVSGLFPEKVLRGR